MRAFPLAPVLALCLAACDGSGTVNEAPARAKIEPSRIRDTPSARDDRTIVSEAPFTPQSGEGAADVVQTYYALIEARRYQDAWKLRWESRDAKRAEVADFARSFERYRDYHATIGVPSLIQREAGSLFVEVPVQTYGTLASGKAFGTSGTITLRRIDDSPGSSVEARSWKIYTR